MKKEPSLFYKRSIAPNRIIYTPSDFAKSSLLYLQETGMLKADRIHTSSRKNLLSYLFFIVIDGEGTLEYDGLLYHLKKNTCVFIDCRKPYVHATSENLCTLKWVHFYGPSMGAIYEKYLSRGGKSCFQSNNVEAYFKCLERLYFAAESSSYVRDMKIHEILSGLLVLLMKDSWNIETGIRGIRGISNLQNIKEYLDQNYTINISLSELGEKFFINKFYLSKLFKEQYGVTICKYIIQMRINKSKRLMRFTSMTIEQIAYECGFSSPGFFSRQFKKNEDESPTDYRKAWKGMD